MNINDIPYEDRIYAYVVEGVTDEDKLKKAGCKYVIRTGGVFIQADIINLIKMTSKVRKIVILTDPDGPGEKIRYLVKKELDSNSWVDLKADKENAKNSKKVGIAQMKMKDLIELLKPFLDHDIKSNEIPPYAIYSLYEMKLTGDNSSTNKEHLEKNLGIHIPSSKTLCMYLNMLALTVNQIDNLKSEK